MEKKFLKVGNKIYFKFNTDGLEYDLIPGTVYNIIVDRYTEMCIRDRQEVAQIKDNGETAKHGGVNNLPESSKVIKMARQKTNKVKAKRSNLVCTNLKDHRKKTGRLLLSLIHI